MTGPGTGGHGERDGFAAIHLGAGWRSRVPAAWLAGWTPQRFALAGGATEVVVMGSGPPLVLLPPLPGYKEAWIACSAPLAREFRVITFDLRTRFARGPRWQALLDDVSRVVDATTSGQVGMAGHSLGGALAQRWALANPSRVAALVLSSTFARVANPRGNRWARFVEQPFVLASQRLLPDALARRMARGFARRAGWVYDPRCDDAVLDLVRFCIRDLPVSAAVRTVALAMAHDTRATLAALAPPTRLIVGERESVMYKDAIAEMRALLPAADFVASPGASHLHPLSSPAWLVERIAEWMRGRVPDRGTG